MKVVLERVIDKPYNVFRACFVFGERITLAFRNDDVGLFVDC
jgi:hypothetical protein